MTTGMVIVHYNDLESLTDLINNVKDYKILDKIIIVDNNSKKEIKTKLKELTNSKIELIENSDNKGFSYAINIGCKRLIELYKECNIIVSNSDIIINKENDLKELTSYLKDNIGVVAPQVVEGNSLNRGWRNPSPMIDALMNIVYIHRRIRKKYVFYKEEHYKDKISYVDVVSGCFFLINSKTLENIDFLDENVFLYYEENILSKKIKDINKKEIVCNDISIIHNHSISIDKNIKNIKKLKIQKKSQYYFQKVYNKANIFERGLLKLTAFLSRVILSIVYFFKDLIKK